MASSNGNGNLVDEFEEAFQACLHSLTKQESSRVEEDVVKMEVETTTLKFIDLARQMEAFFLQKRFLLSALKPELVLKEENLELRYEITRKDELIKKHYEKIDQWKSLLSDQQNNFGKMLPQGQMPPGASNMPGMANPVGPNQQQQMMPGQNIQQQQQMQMQAQQQQQHQMFLQQQQRGGGGGNVFPGGQGAGQQQQLLGPLAFLEKTTSNIDLGLGDSRR